MAALRRFAERPLADGGAVRPATLDRSNGQTEGRINRLKTPKRQMHGRAGLDPLERRFLLAAWSPKPAETPFHGATPARDYPCGRNDFGAQAVGPI